MQDVVVFHFGRTGSTLIDRCLQQNPGILTLDEVFTEAAHDGVSLSSPTEMMNHYVAKRDRLISASASEKSFSFFQVKYLNVSHVTAKVALEPLLAEIDEFGIRKVILLRRRNVVKRISSVLKAANSQVYHVSAEQDVSPASYRFPMRQIDDYGTGVSADNPLSLCRKAKIVEDAACAAILSVFPDTLQLTYEDHLENDPAVAIHRICEVMGIPRFPFKVPLGKTSAGLRHDIENFDEVRACLRGTEFEDMLDE